MNKIVYRLLVFCLIGFVGCSHEDLPTKSSGNNPDEVAISFSAVIPEAKTIITRADGSIDNMHLLVFDENGYFLVRKGAALSGQTATGGTFNVELPASSKPRTIHFIANYDWSNFNDDELIGTNEAGLITALRTSTPTFWTRKALPSGISATTFN